MIILLIVILLFIIIRMIRKYIDNNSYTKDINKSYDEIKDDKGALGEYLIVEELKKAPGYGRILTNLYMPKKIKKNETTEIDIIFIHENGIYVIESKNYAGYIYGKKSDIKWTQVFNKNTKFSFYNPIKQNIIHINALNELLIDCKYKIKSVIVFNNKSNLCKIQIDSSDVSVINTKDLMNLITSNNSIISKKEIDLYYKKLKPFTKVSESVKKEHIEKIKGKYKN